MSTPLIVVAFVGILGMAVGSFLNVVIYRVPREESLIAPDSHCPRCNTPIKWRHNVPVLGWLMLRGKCAACRLPISVRYPIVEAGTGLLFAAITMRFGTTMQLPAYLYLAAIGVTLAMIDFDVRRLPDSIVLPSDIVSVLLLMPAGAVQADWYSAQRALFGMIALWVVYFALALAYPNGMGFSDVKLAGLLGLYLGWLSWGAVLIGVFGGFVVSGAGGAALAATRRGARSGVVVFGPSMIAAALLSVFVAAPVTDWYASILAVT
jgi:leader peptidase (prepilin peptidase) / N-methyltransferase